MDDCRPSVIDEDEIDSDLANFNFVEIFIEISRGFAQKVSKAEIFLITFEPRFR